MATFLDLYSNQAFHLYVISTGIKFGHRMTQTDALRPYGFQIDETPVKGCEKLPFGCDEYWECAVMRNTGPENHQAGSCKMGPASDPLAVVDHELKVRVLHLF